MSDGLAPARPHASDPALLRGPSLNGFAIEASDGRLGVVTNLLFDDASWSVRWMVAHAGHWLNRRTVLIHPAAIGAADQRRRVLSVRLTRAQVEAIPDILVDEPVSRQIDYGEHGLKELDPAWGNPRFVAGVWGGIGSAARTPGWWRRRPCTNPSG